MALQSKDLLGLQNLDAQEIQEILDTAESFRDVLTRDIKKVPTLRGKTLVNLFYEPSTRTRASFELAGKRLSADVVNFSVPASSVVKGESLLDTARSIEAMNADFVVLRHPMAGSPRFLARELRCGVINAGDGAHEHPTQALLDLLTIRLHLGTLQGLKVAMIGDIAHSRVARSNLFGLMALGAEVWVGGPPTMIPPGLGDMGVHVSHGMEQALDGADVVMMLRLQRERQAAGLFPSLREYATLFCLTKERLALAKPQALVMHPGPMNRDVEIASEVADGPASVILEQVTNGVAVRMAVIYLLAGRVSA